ncbi:MAG: ornithine cyclodeaminase family protein [Candidatus Bathyarchaeia archaeon]
MANEITLLSREDVQSTLTMRDAIEATRIAIVDHHRKRTQMVKRRYLFLDKGRIGCMAAYIESIGSAGVKVVNTFHENPAKYNLPAISALIILCDIDTGLPRVIMDGTYITMMRTGAISALATEYLARRDSKTAGIIGAGEQGKGQLLGLKEVLDLERVYVYDVDKGRMDRFAEQMGRETGLEVLGSSSAEEVVRRADVLATATPSMTPVVFNKWVNPGLHINSVGGASRGEQEIDTEILKRSKLVVDDFENASTLGGIAKPISSGELSKGDIYAELGEIVAGEKPGRASQDELTVFISSGLAIQDVAIAQAVLERATGLGTKIRLM